MSATENSIQRLYVAYFNRPADPISLQVYADMIDSGSKTLEQIAAEYFASSQEYLDLYAGKSNAQIIDQLYQNIFGRSAEADGLVYWAAKLTSGEMTVADIALTLSYSAQGTDADVVSARIEAAVAFTTALDTPAEITGYSGNDAAAEGRTYLAQISGALPTDTATITAAKDAAVADVDVSVAAAVAAGTPGMASQTFTHTTSADDFTGGGGADTFNGAHSDAEKTWTVSDQIDGGDGSDTLSLTFGTMTAGTTMSQGATITSVENFEIKNVSGQTITQDFSAITGEENVASNLSTGVVTVTNLASGTSFDVVGNGALTNGASNVGYAAAVTAADLDIMGGTTAGAITITGAAVTSVALTSTGAANTTGTITVPATATSATIDATTKLTAAITGTVLATITVTGAGGADLNSAALDNTVDVINASAATGDVDILAGNTAANTNPGTVDVADLTITTGSGNDEVSTVNVDATDEISVSTGDGDDLVTIDQAIANSSATLAGDVLDGGDGTDILAMTSAVANGVATATNTVSNFEEITITDALAANFSASLIGGGISTVNLAAGGTGTITGAAGTLTINVQAPLTGAFGATDTGTATTDVVNIVNEDAAANSLGGQAITSTGYETVNITTTGTGAATTQTVSTVTITPDTGGTATLNISGGNSFTTTGIITAHVVDASGLAAGKALVMGAAMESLAAAGASATLTGSSGNDTLTGDTGESTNISGEAGNDIITGGTAAETIDGGAGNDIINGGGGADTITGGAGTDTITLGGTAESVDAGADNDTVVAAGNLTYGNTYVGGDGTDTISASAGVSSADGSGVSGFETLSITAAGTMTMTNFANNTFSTVTIGALGATTIASVSTEVVQVTGVMTGDLTVNLASATGTSDSLTVDFKSATGITATNEVVAAGVETINLTLTDTTTASADVNTVLLTVDSATTLNISGNQGVTFAGSSDIADITTVDASGVVLGAVTATGLTWAASYNTVGGVTTITGTNGVDSLTGGTNTNDTISGGSGVDTIVFTGTGVDTYTGGAGNDVFDVDSTGQAATATEAFTITDAAYGDTVDLVGASANAIADMTAANWDSAEVTLGSAATFGNYLDAAAAGNTGAAAGLLKWFYFEGNTYIVLDNSNNTTFTVGTDMIIKLNGTLDIDQSSVTNEIITFGGP